MKDLKPGFCLLLPTKVGFCNWLLFAELTNPRGSSCSPPETHRRKGAGSVCYWTGMELTIQVIDPSLLGEALARLSKAAKTKNLSVHMPRIGDKMPGLTLNFSYCLGFNWYSTERLIRSRLVQKNVNVTVYYFRHNKSEGALSHHELTV